MIGDRGTITGFLDQLGGGIRNEDIQQVQDELYSLVESRLRAMAKAQKKREYGSNSVNATELLDDAFIDLLGPDGPQFQDREHFYALAYKMMRRSLIHRARKRTAARRTPDPVVKHSAADSSDPAQIAELNDEIDSMNRIRDRLQTHHPRVWLVVEHHGLAGLTLQETAEELNITLHRVRADWQFGKAWLRREFLADEADGQ